MNREHQAKPYLELTTAFLLANRSENEHPTIELPYGSLLLTIPRSNIRILHCFRQIADSFNRRGGRVVIEYET